jgi:dTDP-glucose 4,6-dehydratase
MNRSLDSILVTGGAGFIGSNFARLLLARRAGRVVVLDALTYAGSRETVADLESDDRFVFVQGDIADRKAVDAIYREHRPRWVVNFAAESHVDRSIDGPREFVRTNIAGAFELVDAARVYAGGLSREARDGFRFLQVSTDEVYGSLGPDGFFSESTPYAPTSPYAASKASADHVVGSYYHTFGLEVLITNCSNNYGPYQFPEKLIPLMILNAIEGKRLPIYGDGQNIRDWLHVGDHCEAIVQVLEKGRIGQKYNIGAHNERTNVQVVDQICAVLDEEYPVRDNTALRGLNVAHYGELKEYVRDRPGHDRRYAIDPTRVLEEIGWRPRHDFEAGIRETVRWYLANRRWCDAVQVGRYERQRLGLAEGGHR